MLIGIILATLIHTSLCEDNFANGWYDYLPMFMHTCRFYGGITDQDMIDYEFDKYQMLTVEKGEYLFEDIPSAGVNNEASKNNLHTEWKMIDTCKKFKNTYGMDKICFLYYNELLHWKWFKLSDDYEAYRIAQGHPNVIQWARTGDATFPDSSGITVPDLRYHASVDTVSWWLNHISSVVNAPENASYVDGIFVDRGYVASGTNGKEASGIWTPGVSSSTNKVTSDPVKDSNGNVICNEGAAHGLTCFEDYMLGKRDALNRLETEHNIKTVVNPGSYYYESFVTDAKFMNGGSTISEEDMYSYKYYFQNTSMIHFENFCVTGHDVYRLYKAIKAGKEVQVHGGYSDDCQGLLCKDYMRRYLAAYLMGIEPDAKTFFICNRYWSLNQDSNEARDESGKKNTYYELYRFAEYELPLGMPGDRVLQSDTSSVVTMVDNFNLNTYRPFYNRTTGVFNAVVVWQGNNNAANTVCYVNDCTPGSFTPGVTKRCMGNSPTLCPVALGKFSPLPTPNPTKSPTQQPTMPNQTPQPNANPVQTPQPNSTPVQTPQPNANPVSPTTSSPTSTSSVTVSAAAGGAIVVVGVGGMLMYARKFGTGGGGAYGNSYSKF